jgi:hypothetical protein
MSPQAALANQVTEPPSIACPPRHDSIERTQAARIIFDRLPIEVLPAFPVGVPLRSVRSLRLVPTVDSPDLALPREVAAPAHRLRLTLRGRVVLAALAVVAFGAVAGVLHLVASGSGAATAAVSGGHASIVVQPGQSLWSIATTLAPKADPRVTVAKIVDLNGIVGSSVYAEGARAC